MAALLFLALFRFSTSASAVTFPQFLVKFFPSARLVRARDELQTSPSLFPFRLTVLQAPTPSRLVIVFPVQIRPFLGKGTVVNDSVVLPSTSPSRVGSFFRSRLPTDAYPLGMTPPPIFACPERPTAAARQPPCSRPKKQPAPTLVFAPPKPPAGAMEQL